MKFTCIAVVIVTAERKKNDLMHVSAHRLKMVGLGK